MKENEFGCTDIIKSLVISNRAGIKDICGSGYSDQTLFTAKKCTIIYHFQEIKLFIKANNIPKILHSWGKRETPTVFQIHIDDFKVFCELNNVLIFEDCPSPSGRLKGKEHKRHLADFYKSHLFKPAHNSK